eukprot:3323129-Ditylum_brightwellii.AAC.1
MSVGGAGMGGREVGLGHSSQVAEADRDAPCFDKEIKKFYLSYCNNEAKDTMIDYLDNLK